MLIAFIIAFSLSSCGGSETIVETPTSPILKPSKPPVKVPPGSGPSGSTTFAGTIKPLTAKHCGLSGCHAGAGFLKSEAAFLNSRSKIRVGNGTMPPQYSPVFGQWTQKEKTLFSNYFDAN